MQLKATAWILAGLMCGAAVAGVLGRPNTTASQRGAAITLETAVPKGFGEWSELPDQGGQVVNPQTKELLDKLYSQILTAPASTRTGTGLRCRGVRRRPAAGCRHRPEVC